MNKLEKGGPIDANNIYHIDTHPIETVTGNHSIISTVLIKILILLYDNYSYVIAIVIVIL